jgi:hypothetical protein
MLTETKPDAIRERVRAFLAERDVRIPDADRIGQVGEG